VLAAVVVGIAGIAVPRTAAGLALQALALETAGIVLAVFLVLDGRWTWARVQQACLGGPNPCLLAFLAWIALSTVFSPLPEFSRWEALRQLGGALIYLAVVYGLSVERHLGVLQFALAAAACLAVGSASVSLRDQTTPFMEGAYQNTQLLAAFTGLVLPVLAMASAGDGLLVPLAALSGTVLATAGLLLSQNRSAWAGTLVAGRWWRDAGLAYSGLATCGGARGGGWSRAIGLPKR